MKRAYYSLGSGPFREILSLLHAPYTALHLSFVVLGAALAPTIHADRLIASLVAFFLAVGISAHFFDELKGRPMGTRVSNNVLLGGGIASLAVACGIGAFGVRLVSPYLLLFIAAGIFMVLAYNLELFGGRFHGDSSFALFWGVFPFLTTNWIMNESMGGLTLLGAAACFWIAKLQRFLSTSARLFRRDVSTIEGQLRLSDGSVRPLSVELLLEAPEKALRALCFAVPLLALAVLWSRS